VNALIKVAVADITFFKVAMHYVSYFHLKIQKIQHAFPTKYFKYFWKDVFQNTILSAFCSQHFVVCYKCFYFTHTCSFNGNLTDAGSYKVKE